jgi:hypothetical protein
MVGKNFNGNGCEKQKLLIDKFYARLEALGSA